MKRTKLAGDCDKDMEKNSAISESLSCSLEEISDLTSISSFANGSRGNTSEFL
jgi:hypothetical protein